MILYFTSRVFNLRFGFGHFQFGNTFLFAVRCITEKDMTLHAGSDIKILLGITYRVEKNLFYVKTTLNLNLNFFFQGNQRYSFPNNREEKFQIRPTKADNVLPFLEQNFAEEKFSRYNELSVFIIFL